APFPTRRSSDLLHALLDVGAQRVGVGEGERGEHEGDDGGAPGDPALRAHTDPLDFAARPPAGSGPAAGAGATGSGRSSSWAAGSSAGAHPPSLVDASVNKAPAPIDAGACGRRSGPLFLSGRGPDSLARGELREGRGAGVAGGVAEALLDAQQLVV